MQLQASTRTESETGRAYSFTILAGVDPTMIFDNNVSNDQFETITTVPVGMPGNPAVYAQPNPPPQLYSG